AALIGRARAQRARRRGGVLAAGLVAAVIAVSVGVVATGDDNGSLTASSQLERGDDGAAGGSSDKDRSEAPNQNYAPPSVPTGGGLTAGQLPFTGGPLPEDKYADRAPITGTSCPPARTDPPEAPTGAGSSGPLLAFVPQQAWACVYLADGSPVATELTGAQTAAAVAVLSSGSPLSADVACTSEFGPSLRLIISGATQTATIDAQSYGCGVVTNGAASRQAKAQVVALLAQLDDNLRPLG
ncbi:MAG: hypothetical protein JWN61_2898, partial [Pseudonocardiales bacterium]|nr:hypothetical protein [Pseudonocardiales bacterium]